MNALIQSFGNVLREIATKIWPWIVMMSLAYLYIAIKGTALAATYNMYFNNTEQGANSTASPQLSVGQPGATPAANPSAAPAAEPAKETQTVQYSGNTPVPQTAAPTPPPAVAQANIPSARAFRLGLLGHSVTGYTNVLRAQSAQNFSHWGGSLMATVFITPEFGITAFGGSSFSSLTHFGGEVELIPLKLEVFGHKEFLEIAGLAGITALRGAAKRTWIHAGVRTTLNLTERVGLTAALRTNVSDRIAGRHLFAETGVTLRF